MSVSKIIFGVLCLLAIFSSFSFAQIAQHTLDSQLVLTPTDTNATAFNVSVLAFESGQSQSGTQLRTILEQINRDCQAMSGTPNFDLQSCIQNQSQQRLSSSTSYRLNVTAVQNAHVSFVYRTAQTGDFVGIEGCSDIVTSTPVLTSRINPATGVSEPFTYYVGVCNVPRNFYAGKTRVTVKAIFVPAEGQDIRGATAEFTVNNAVVSTDTSFTNNVNSLLQRISEGRESFMGSPAALPCFGVFFIVGLLLASMYFAGKSPVSLLDITTPKIPGPKGIAASGQILAPFGYTELKRVTKDGLAANIAALGEMSNRFAAGMRNNASLASLGSAINRIPTPAADVNAKDPNPKGYARALVIGGLRAGMTQAQLAPLTNTLPYHYKDAQHKVANEIFAKLEAMGGREKIYAGVLRDYLYGVRTFQSLEVLTAHPDIAQRSAAHYWLTSKLGMAFGAQRYAILGGVVMSGTDSMFRSGRVVGRLMKGAATHAPYLAGQVAKTTIAMVGGQRALERIERAAATSTTASAVNSLISRAPNAISVGQMTPLIGKMEHLYAKLRDEVTHDQMRYVLRQFYRSKGLNFDMSAERMATMGHVDMDILRESGFTRLTAVQRAEIAAAEERIRSVLSNVTMTSADKLSALRDIAVAGGAHIDNSMMLMTARVAAVDAAAQPDYIKMVSLYQLLESQHATAAAAVNRATGADAYVCHVGSSAVPERGVWEHMVLRTMIWDGENGYLKGGVAQELVSARLKTANRLATLDPTAFAGGSELPEHMRPNPTVARAVVERNKSELMSLLTDDGRAMLGTFLKGRNKTSSTATIADLVDFMYGGTMARPWQQNKEKSGLVYYDKEEAGLVPKATLVDLKGRWLASADPQTRVDIGHFVNARFTRSYVPPADAAIEAQLNRNSAHSGWSVEQRAIEAKKLWVRKLMLEDMEARFNSLFANNAYGTTAETMRYYGGLISGTLAHALDQKNLPANHPDRQFVEEGNFSDPKRLGRLRELMLQYRKDIEASEGRNVTYTDITNGKRAMVMTQEGGYVYYSKGMTLSTGDRVYGDVVMRDDKGVHRQIAVENVAIRISDPNVAREFDRVRSIKDPAEWRNCLDGVVKWTNEKGITPAESYERRQMLAGVLHNFGNTTGVYQSKWHDHSTVEVIPKLQSTPVAPNVLGLVGQDSTLGRKVADKVIKPARDIGLHLGNYISAIALAGAGALLTTSYDIAAVSNVQRMHGMKMAMQIASGDLPADLTKAERSKLDAIALRYNRWKQVHDFVIDRNPWRESSSYGSGQAYRAKFNMGPREVYKAHQYFGAYFNTAEYRNFMWGPYGGFMDTARKLLMPLQSMMGAIQQSMQGYPSSWDTTGNPLREVDHTDVRFLESVQNMNPLNHTSNKYLRMLNVWKGSAEQRDVAGPAFRAGLEGGPLHILDYRKGMYGNVRLGGASPSLSHYDYRMEYKEDPAMAEYKFRTKEGLYVHDRRLRDQAMDNTVRRTVSAEELAIKRRQELASYGITTNPLFGWATPLGFAWHIPFPLFPQSLTPRDIVARQLERSRGGQGGGILESIQNMGRGAYEGTVRLMQPHMVAKITYCAYCKTSNYRGTECKNPRCVGRKYNY